MDITLIKISMYPLIQDAIENHEVGHICVVTYIIKGESRVRMGPKKDKCLGILSLRVFFEMVAWVAIVLSLKTKIPDTAKMSVRCCRWAYRGYKLWPRNCIYWTGVCKAKKLILKIMRKCQSINRWVGRHLPLHSNLKGLMV